MRTVRIPGTPCLIILRSNVEFAVLKHKAGVYRGPIITRIYQGHLLCLLLYKLNKFIYIHYCSLSFFIINTEIARGCNVTILALQKRSPWLSLE
jgi:hypothetical protein